MIDRKWLALALVCWAGSTGAQEPSGQPVEVTTATVIKTAPGEAKAKVVFSSGGSQPVDVADDESMEMGEEDMGPIQ